VQDAQKAIRSGIATEEQQAVLEAEAKRKEMLEAKTATKKPGVLTRTKQWLFSGLKREEEGEDFGSSERRLGYEATNEEDDMLGERESDILRAIEEKREEIKQKAKKAFEKEKELERKGGPLDRLGAEGSVASTGEQPKSGGWLSFMSRK